MKHPAARTCASVTCPLNQLQVGAFARIHRLPEAGAASQRLREIGFCERQLIRLVSHAATVVCQVCNTRLAISGELAGAILVEPVSIR